MPTTAAALAAGGDPLGQRAARGRTGGASDSIAASVGEQPRSAGRCARTSALQAAAPVGRQRAAQQPQPPRVREQREDRPRAAAGRPSGRRCRRSTCARVASISLSYCTPDGQAVTQAMQPRQASKCRDHRVAHRLAVEAGLHQVDPAPRASPSPRPTARRSGRSAGRSRSARSRRPARPTAGGARRRRLAQRVGTRAGASGPGCRRSRRPDRRAGCRHLRCLPRSGRATAGGRGRTRP